jgi:5-methylcytosine-specific restriction endonuclease McrA
MQNSEVLVLNSGFVPLRIANIYGALSLVVTKKAYSVIEEDSYVKSPSLIIRIPSVISLIHYGDFPKKKVMFSKLNVIYRDDLVCQYCGEKHKLSDLTVDHIIPRCKWTFSTTPTIWENLVACCIWCNRTKGNRTLKELGWKVLKKPVEPTYLPHLVISLKKAKERGWLDFCKVNVRLIESL